MLNEPVNPAFDFPNLIQVSILERNAITEMKIKSNAKWKSIPLSQNFFANIESSSSLCGGIEELTDYTIVTKTSKSGKVQKRPLSCKKSALAPEDLSDEPVVKKKKNVFNVIETENEKPNEDKSKKAKQKKKKKKKASSKPNVNLDALNLKVQESNPSEAVVKSDKSEPEEKEKVTEKKPKTKKKSKATAEKKVPESSSTSVPLSSEAEEEVSKVIETENKSAEKEVSDSSSSSVPLSEMSEWREMFVCDEIVAVLAEKGFRSPTPIQRMTLTAALKGKMDIVGAAETGSGKTLAFGIPIIQGIMEDRKYEQEHPTEHEKDDGPEEIVEQDPVDEEEDVDTEHEEKAVNVVDNIKFDFDLDDDDVNTVSEEITNTRGDKLRAVVLTPTRELALQIHKHLARVGGCGGVGVVVVVGGLSVDKQIRLLNRRPSIIVATPGRLWDLIQVRKFIHQSPYHYNEQVEYEFSSYPHELPHKDIIDKNILYQFLQIFHQFLQSSYHFLQSHWSFLHLFHDHCH